MEQLASSLLFCVANLSYWWEIPGQTKTGFYSISHQSGQVQRGDPSWKSEAARSIRISIEGHISVSVMNMNHIRERGRKGAMDLRAVVGTKPALSEGTHGPYASKQLVPTTASPVSFRQRHRNAGRR